MNKEAIVPLTSEDALCLRRYFHCYVMADHGKEKMLTKEEENFVNNKLPQKIQKAIKENEINLSNGVRVHIRSQTMKDTILDYPSTQRIKETMKKQLEILCKNPVYQTSEVLPDTNMIIQAFYYAAMDELILFDIKEIENFLLNTEKVDLELKQLLDDNSEKIEISIVPFNKDIPLSSYFRGFIGKNGKLNGFCQYFNFLYFPELIPFVMKINKLVQDKFEKEMNEIVTNSYNLPCVVDFCLSYDQSELFEIKIFRIIPFSEEKIEEILEDELFSSNSINQLLYGKESTDNNFFIVNTKPVDTDVLRKYISPNMEFAMDEIVFEFHNNRPVDLNLVGGLPDWCSLI